MAVRVRVKNFQSIKEAEITIDGLTAITGPNNTGKSAMLRAIRGVAENTRGTAFVRHGAAQCEVELTFEDGRTVKWIKGPKTKPTYIIDGGKPIHPGQGVPDEVKTLLGVHTITAGGRDIWPQVAKQLSGQVFLLDEPGSVLAEAVANVDRVGRLNRALKAAEKDRRAATSELKVRVKDRDQHEADVKGYEGLDTAVREIEAIETAHNQAERVGKALMGVTVLRNRVAKARDTVASLEGVEAVSVPAAGDSEALVEELEELERLKTRMKRAEDRVAKYDGVQNVDVDVDVHKAEKLAMAMGTAEALKGSIGHVKIKIEALEQTLAQPSGKELEPGADFSHVRNHQDAGFGGGYGANVSHEIGDGEVGLMAHCGDYRDV